MDLYWTRRMFFPFSSRQNNRACIFEVGDDRIDLDYFCLKMPLFFHLRLGAHLVPIPTAPGHSVIFDVQLKQHPWKKKMCCFSCWVDWKWRPWDKRELFQGYVLHHTMASWTYSSKESLSQASFRTSLWAFFIKKIRCLCFSKLFVTSHALSWQKQVYTGRSLWSMATSRHAWPTCGLVS